jgi:hypothetical protein
LEEEKITKYASDFLVFASNLEPLTSDVLKR